MPYALSNLRQAKARVVHCGDERGHPVRAKRFQFGDIAFRVDLRPIIELLELTVTIVKRPGMAQCCLARMQYHVVSHGFESGHPCELKFGLLHDQERLPFHTLVFVTSFRSKSAHEHVEVQLDPAHFEYLGRLRLAPAVHNCVRSE